MPAARTSDKDAVQRSCTARHSCTTTCLRLIYKLVRFVVFVVVRRLTVRSFAGNAIRSEESSTASPLPDFLIASTHTVVKKNPTVNLGWDAERCCVASSLHWACVLHTCQFITAEARSFVLAHLQISQRQNAIGLVFVHHGGSKGGGERQVRSVRTATRWRRMWRWSVAAFCAPPTNTAGMAAAMILRTAPQCQ